MTMLILNESNTNDKVYFENNIIIQERCKLFQYWGCRWKRAHEWMLLSHHGRGVRETFQMGVSDVCK